MQENENKENINFEEKILKKLKRFWKNSQK